MAVPAEEDWTRRARVSDGEVVRFTGATTVFGLAFDGSRAGTGSDKGELRRAGLQVLCCLLDSRSEADAANSGVWPGLGVVVFLKLYGVAQLAQ